MKIYHFFLLLILFGCNNSAEKKLTSYNELTNYIESGDSLNLDKSLKALMSDRKFQSEGLSEENYNYVCLLYRFNEKYEELLSLLNNFESEDDFI